MAQPSFLAGGVNPRITDTRWITLARWLGVLQNEAGSLSSNNPRPNDSRKRLLTKINRAKLGIG